MVTPLPLSLTLPLGQSLQEGVVTQNRAIDSVIPVPADGLLTYEQAVRLAIYGKQEGAVDTNWDADTGDLSRAASALPNDPQWAGRRIYEDDRTFYFSDLRAGQLWKIVVAIGGDHG